MLEEEGVPCDWRKDGVLPSSGRHTPGHRRSNGGSPTLGSCVFWMPRALTTKESDKENGRRGSKARQPRGGGCRSRMSGNGGWSTKEPHFLSVQAPRDGRQIDPWLSRSPHATPEEGKRQDGRRRERSTKRGRSNGRKTGHGRRQGERRSTTKTRTKSASLASTKAPWQNLLRIAEAPHRLNDLRETVDMEAGRSPSVCVNPFSVPSLPLLPHHFLQECPVASQRASELLNWCQASGPP